MSEMETMSQCLLGCASEWLGYLDFLPDNFLYSAASSIASGFMVWVVLKYVVFKEEGPRKYTIPPPKFPDEEREVEEANIKISGTTAIQCYAPATGQFLGFVNPATPDGIDRAIEQAAAAQKTWAKTTFRERRAVLRSMLQYVLENQHELCRIACLDSGKTMVDAQLGEVLVTAEKLTWTLKHGEAALRPSRRPTNLLMTYKRNEVRYEPLGVVAALISWNYPFHNLIGPVISAIFAGNAIVVKASEQTAWSANYFANVAREALKVHGHDPALVQPIVCWPHVAPHLSSHRGIAHITFIGSRPVCHKVAASAAQSLTPLVAELGGKDPSIILSSAKNDLPRISKILLKGTFQSAGQNCIGIERIIVAPSLYDELISMLEPKVKALRLGPKADVGAMVSPGCFPRLEELIALAVKDGARLLAGGRRYVHPDFPKAHYFQPTLLVDVTPQMAIANEECFGPVMLVMRATTPKPKSSPHETAETILSIANAPDFGLGASIFGSESDPVLPMVVDGLRAGGVAINDFAVFYAVQLPFGGVGGSGYGRFAGEEGLRGLCNAKSVCADRMAWLGIRTGIPPPVQYPVADQERSWRFTGGIVELGYSLTFGGMFRGLFNLLKNS